MFALQWLFYKVRFFQKLTAVFMLCGTAVFVLGCQEAELIAPPAESGNSNSITTKTSPALNTTPSLVYSLISVLPNTVASGSPVTVKLTLYNAENVRITTGGQTVTFNNSGGTSTGTFGAVTDNLDGTHTVTFTSTTSGTATSITATIGGSNVTSASPTITVNPGPISVSQSVMTRSAATVGIGANITLTLTAKDANGNSLTSGGRIVVFSSSGGTSTGTIGATTDVGNGTYTASFTGVNAGTATSINATVDGSSVTSASPTVTVTSCTDRSTVIFSSTMDVTAGATTSLNVWITRSDGGGQTTALTENTLALQHSIPYHYSPDYSKIVYYSRAAIDGSTNGTASLSYNIFMMNADGTGKTALTKNTVAGLDSLGPSFSPDGNKIVFYSTMALSNDGLTSTNQTWNGTATNYNNIWTIDLSDSNRLKARTRNNGNNSGGNMRVGHNYYPVYSPNGTKIAWASGLPYVLNRSTDGVPVTYYIDNANNIWIMNFNSDPLANPDQLAIESDKIPLTKYGDGTTSANYPNFSPDGTRIAFYSKGPLNGSWIEWISFTYTPSPNATNNIWRINTDGTNLTKLTQNSISGLDSLAPSYSIDGTKIVFRSKTDLNPAIWDGTQTESQNIWIMNADGSGVNGGRTPITRNTLVGLDSLGPRYSPDGAMIAFYSRTAESGVWDGTASTAYNLWTWSVVPQTFNLLMSGIQPSISKQFSLQSPSMWGRRCF